MADRMLPYWQRGGQRRRQPDSGGSEHSAVVDRHSV
jgi:hypothetical protein